MCVCVCMRKSCLESRYILQCVLGYLYFFVCVRMLVSMYVHTHNVSCTHKICHVCVAIPRYQIRLCRDTSLSNTFVSRYLAIKYVCVAIPRYQIRLCRDTSLSNTFVSRYLAIKYVCDAIPRSQIRNLLRTHPGMSIDIRYLSLCKRYFLLCNVCVCMRVYGMSIDIRYISLLVSASFCFVTFVCVYACVWHVYRYQISLSLQALLFAL